ncbi:hypothetical protein [Hymenobacter weizhouensis]|uniref:hypothetical protein n=1 Tax=Hymenobacter sp. YIM 151500-1 TaxID=2987689 RepID=UPI002226A255|nr:hypothetical protein [Hymenobacter sp. YIM 151500-1]UYZ62681.1 hypothetical protein OIS53_16975 [Hymenobacter sp. YIM 151500-1]
MYYSATLTFLYRADLHLFVARWLDEPAPSLLHAEYAALLNAGEQHSTPRWLIDVRRRPTPSPDVARWVSQEWLPQIVTALAPQRPRLAYLVSPSREEALRTDPALQASVQAAYATDRGYDLGTFGDEGSAMQWLQAR